MKFTEQSAPLPKNTTYVPQAPPGLPDSPPPFATAALKEHDADLFPHDPVYGPSGKWRINSPIVQGTLKCVLIPAGYDDPLLPFRLMTGVMVMVYFGGMYSLLYRQCRSWSIATFVTVLSSTIVYTLGRSYWGLGPLASMTPPTLVLAITPLILLSYLRYENQWRILLVFAFVGVCGNLHWVTAANLTIALLIVYLGRHRFAPSCWPTAIGCLLCAIIGAMPYTAYYFHLRFTDMPAGAAISAEAAYQVYPTYEMLKPFSEFAYNLVACEMPEGIVYLFKAVGIY